MTLGKKERMRELPLSSNSMGKGHCRSPTFLPGPWERGWEELHRIAGIPLCGKGCCGHLGHIWIPGRMGS